MLEPTMKKYLVISFVLVMTATSLVAIEPGYLTVEDLFSELSPLQATSVDLQEDFASLDLEALQTRRETIEARLEADPRDADWMELLLVGTFEMYHDLEGGGSLRTEVLAKKSLDIVVRWRSAEPESLVPLLVELELRNSYQLSTEAVVAELATRSEPLAGMARAFNLLQQRRLDEALTLLPEPETAEPRAWLAAIGLRLYSGDAELEDEARAMVTRWRELDPDALEIASLELSLADDETSAEVLGDLIRRLQPVSPRPASLCSAFMVRELYAELLQCAESAADLEIDDEQRQTVDSYRANALASFEDWAALDELLISTAKPDYLVFQHGEALVAAGYCKSVLELLKGIEVSPWYSDQELALRTACGETIDPTDHFLARLDEVEPDMLMHSVYLSENVDALRVEAYLLDRIEREPGAAEVYEALFNLDNQRKRPLDHLAHMLVWAELVNEARPYRQIARILEAGAPDLAIEYLDKALELEPRDVQAWLSRLELTLDDELEMIAEIATIAVDDELGALLISAQLKVLQGLPEEGLAALNPEVLLAFRNSQIAWTGVQLRTELLAELELDDQLELWILRQATPVGQSVKNIDEIGPKEALMLASSLAGHERMDRALARYLEAEAGMKEGAAEEGPSTQELETLTWIDQQLAEVLRSLGQLDEAAQRAERAWKASTDEDPWGLQLLLDIDLERLRYDRVEELTRDIDVQSSDGWSDRRLLRSRGEALIELDRADEAFEIAEHLVANDEDDYEALFLLGRAQEALGEGKPTITAWRQFLDGTEKLVVQEGEQCDCYCEILTKRDELLRRMEEQAS